MVPDIGHHVEAIKKCSKFYVVFFSYNIFRFPCYCLKNDCCRLGHSVRFNLKLLIFSFKNSNIYESKKLFLCIGAIQVWNVCCSLQFKKTPSSIKFDVISRNIWTPPILHLSSAGVAAMSGTHKHTYYHFIRNNSNWFMKKISQTKF